MAIITDPGMKKNKQIEQIFKEITKEKVSLFSLLKEIASIPSPTGSEKKKMLFLKEKLKEIDMEALIDNIGNCIVKLSANASNSKKKTILVVAHADTACDPGKDHKITEDARYIYGHGICDDSTGITGLLTTISLIKKHKIITILRVPLQENILKFMKFTEYYLIVGLKELTMQRKINISLKFK